MKTLVRSGRRRTTRSARGGAAVLLITALALTAGCGQKAGVAGSFAGSGTATGAQAGAAGVAGTDGLGGSGGLGGGAGGGKDGAGSAAGLSGGGGSGGLGGTASGGTGASGTDGEGSAPLPGAPGDPDAPDAPGEGDSTGVTDSTIKIGIHAPVTGAAAIPQQSFERAVGVYFDAVNRAGGIHGRNVEVLFRDDGFDPNRARTECKRLAEQDEVFLLIGGGGADQIDACARYAASTGVPYLSGGVHETRPGLGDLSALPTYFAMSLTYEQQIPLLVRLVQQQFDGDKVALIVADNDSLNNFYSIADSKLKSTIGSDLVLSRRIPKNTTSDAASIGTSICNSGAQAVVWNASPSTLLNVSKSMACRVTFIGPGLTNGLNVVAQVGCPNVDGALFYSPFPGLDVMRRDSAFVNAYRAKNGGSQPDDIGAAMYGLEKLVGAMLQANGKELTRQSFMATIARVKTFNTGVFPATNFTSRFGGTAMHLLQADCGSNEYVTVRRNERP